jgi:hypothetical protein
MRHWSHLLIGGPQIADNMDVHDVHFPLRRYKRLMDASQNWKSKQGNSELGLGRGRHAWYSVILPELLASI